MSPYVTQVTKHDKKRATLWPESQTPPAVADRGRCFSMTQAGYMVRSPWAFLLRIEALKGA